MQHSLFTLDLAENTVFCSSEHFCSGWVKQSFTKDNSQKQVQRMESLFYEVDLSVWWCAADSLPRLHNIKFAFKMKALFKMFSLCSVRHEIRDVHLVEENVLESLKVKTDFHSFKPRPFNMREFYDRTGHDIKDMLLSCHFHGTECRPEDFNVVSLLTRQADVWWLCLQLQVQLVNI